VIVITGDEWSFSDRLTPRFSGPWSGSAATELFGPLAELAIDRFEELDHPVALLLDRLADILTSMSPDRKPNSEITT
jgi:hypothetical protein